MKRMLIIGAVICTFIAMIVGSIYWWWFEAPHQLTTDVVYGQRDSKPLLLDVFIPPEQNGGDRKSVV